MNFVIADEADKKVKNIGKYMHSSLSYKLAYLSRPFLAVMREGGSGSYIGLVLFLTVYTPRLCLGP